MYRTQAPCKYSVEWFGGQALTTLCFDVRANQEGDDLPDFFAALSRFAAMLPLDFGHITPEYREQSKARRIKASGSFSHLSLRDLRPVLLVPTYLLRSAAGHFHGRGCPTAVVAPSIGEVADERQRGGQPAPFALVR